MTKESNDKGFSAVDVVVVLVVLIAIGLGGFAVWHSNHKTKSKTVANSKAAQSASSNQKAKTTPPSNTVPVKTDPSDNGKYLVISEWNKRVLLPTHLQGKTAYKINADTTTDPDSGLPLQAADIYIASSALEPTACSIISTSVGDSVDTAAEYIKSNNSKPFNAARYKWTFKESILVDGQDSYHLDYVTPDCVGGGANAATIEELQAALPKLSNIN